MSGSFFVCVSRGTTGRFCGCDDRVHVRQFFHVCQKWSVVMACSSSRHMGGDDTTVPDPEGHSA